LSDYTEEAIGSPRMDLPRVLPRIEPTRVPRAPRPLHLPSPVKHTSATSARTTDTELRQVHAYATLFYLLGHNPQPCDFRPSSPRETRDQSADSTYLWDANEDSRPECPVEETLSLFRYPQGDAKGQSLSETTANRWNESENTSEQSPTEIGRHRCVSTMAPDNAKGGKRRAPFHSRRLSLTVTSEEPRLVGATRRRPDSPRWVSVGLDVCYSDMNWPSASSHHRRGRSSKTLRASRYIKDASTDSQSTPRASATYQETCIQLDGLSGGPSVERPGHDEENPHEPSDESAPKSDQSLSALENSRRL
jgi:hypothetical protein